MVCDALLCLAHELALTIESFIGSGCGSTENQEVRETQVNISEMTSITTRDMSDT